MARRRFQTGSVLLRGKKWYGKYREDLIQSDGSVTRVQRRIVLGTKRDYPTKQLAKRQLQATLAKINSLDYRGERIATVEEFAHKWREQALSHLKPSSRHSYESHIKVQIIPMLGRLRISELGIENQQAFVNRLRGTVSRTTITRILATLSSMLRVAKMWGYTTHSVSLRMLSLPATEVQQESRFFLPEQAMQIIALAHGKFRVLLSICAMTGMRIGEALALERPDFDFKRGVIHVRRSVWRHQLTTPKSRASMAIIPLALPLMQVVRPYVDSLPSDQLFVSLAGRHYIAENLNRQVLWPILDKLGIPRCGFHAFRHMYASALFSQGAHPAVAQALLRHADPGITLGTYGHVLGTEHREMNERVAALLVPNGAKSDTQVQLIQ